MESVADGVVFVSVSAATLPLLLDAYEKQQQEIERLRDVVRLIIGRRFNIPWQDVPQSDVDDYLRDLDRIRASQAGRG